MNNTESVIRQVSDVWKDVYHLRQPSTEAVEIKDDDNSDEDEFEKEEEPPRKKGKVIITKPQK